MKGGGLLALVALGALALASRSAGASEVAPSGRAPSGGPPGPLPPGSAIPPGPYPVATLTTPGPHDRDSWRRYSAEVAQLAGEALRALGASDTERIAGEWAVASLALRETSGRSEYGNNPGNLAASQRSDPPQPQADWPNSRFRGRVFGSRREGVDTLVRLLRAGSRYAPAWRTMVANAEAGEPIEPAIAGWLLAIDDAGYTAAPQGPAERQERLANNARIASMVASASSAAGVL